MFNFFYKKLDLYYILVVYCKEFKTKIMKEKCKHLKTSLNGWTGELCCRDCNKTIYYLRNDNKHVKVNE